MEEVTARDVVARLRGLLAQGRTIRQAALELKLPKSTVGRWAQRHHLPRRRRGLTPEKRREVQTSLHLGRTIYATARLAGVSTETVYRMIVDRLHSVIHGGSRPCKPWRCPQCGAMVKVTPCVACGTHKPARTARGKGGTTKSRRRVP